MEYIVREGTRRSLAYLAAGRTTIPAVVFEGGLEVGHTDVRLSDLWSSKDLIDATTPRLAYRYERLVELVTGGTELDPIFVEAGRTEVPIASVPVVYSPDDLPP